MAIDFPTSPSPGDTYSFSGRTWTWNGTGWVATTGGPQGVTGPTGATGATGATGPAVQPLDTTDSPQFAGVNIGNASDTTITRSAAGVIAVEGGVVPKENRANNFTASQTVSSTGSLTVSGSGGLGYSNGSGGSVTQLTSKTTGVTLNKTNGQIVTAADALASGASATFTVTNSTVSSPDTFVMHSQNVNYSVRASDATAGSFKITIKNENVNSLSQAVTINFAVIKAVTA